MIAMTTGNERIQHHPFAFLKAVLNNTNRFMPKDQRWHTTSVVTMIGMHIRTTYSHCLDLNQCFTTDRRRFWFVPVLQFKCVCINECFHNFVLFSGETTVEVNNLASNII